MKKIICLLGIPGSGKTTLGNNIEKIYSFPFFEEKFDEISSVSKEREAISSNFEKCIGFSNLRYSQMQKAQKSEAEIVFIDTCFEMTEIYSEYILNGDEMKEFKRNFDILNTSVVKPDLYVFLTGDLDTILKRALDRKSDLGLDDTYLKKDILEESSNKILNFLNDKKYIEVDVTKTDLRNEKELRKFVETIRSKF